jgi:hypothetical protein
LKEKDRLRVFENWVLRKMFDPKRDEITGEWRRLYEKELYYLHSSPNIRVIKLKRMRWAGNLTRIGKKRAGYMCLVGKSEVKETSSKHRRSWENNIKMNLQEIGKG